MLLNLEKVDREVKRRLDAKEKEHGGPLPPKERNKIVVETLLPNLPKIVKPEHLEAFVKKNLAGSGTMDVREVKFKDVKGDVMRFQVKAQAREETIRTWPHTLSLFFGALDLNIPTGIAPWVMGLETWIVTGLGAGLTLLLSTVITAFFIPNMMRKGTIDLLVSKPVNRWYLLLCKYVAGCRSCSSTRS